MFAHVRQQASGVTRQRALRCAATLCLEKFVWKHGEGKIFLKKINARINLNRNVVFSFLPAPHFRHVDTMSECDVGGQSRVSGVNTHRQKLCVGGG